MTFNEPDGREERTQRRHLACHLKRKNNTDGSVSIRDDLIVDCTHFESKAMTLRSEKRVNSQHCFKEGGNRGCLLPSAGNEGDSQSQHDTGE